MIFIENYKRLIKAVQEIDEVLSIGKSGGKELPVKGENDIDIFVFCNKIPSAKTRQSAVELLGSAISEVTINETSGKFWGVCDFINIDDNEICLMYFTVSEMNDEIETVLNGSRLNRENEYFYPTGRCATFLSMYILCDKTGYIAEDLKNKPEILRMAYEFGKSIIPLMEGPHYQSCTVPSSFRQWGCS